MDRSHRQRIAFFVVGGVLWALWYVTQSPPPFVLWLLPAAAMVTVVMIVVGRRRMHRADEVTTTGRIVSPPSRDPRPMPARWVGGGNLPGALGRTNATWPLVVLEVAVGSLQVSVRPPLLARLFGLPKFSADQASVAEVVPVRSFVGGGGIGIVPASGEPVIYFWCAGPDRSEILDVVGRAGFRVSWEERKARTW